MQAECDLAENFVHAWASMARNGRPVTSALLEDWPEWRPDDARTMILDINNLKSQHMSESRACELFNLHQSLKDGEPPFPPWNLKTGIAFH